MRFNKMKRNLTRISSVLLIFVILLGLYIPAGAESVSNVNDSKLDTGLLRAVGILPDKDISAEYISRADFAVYTARLLSINVFEQNETRYFYDVPMNHYALNSINKLVDLNILSMVDDKEFRPDDTITVGEACKILTAALGYDEMAKYAGGFPGGYITIAKRLDIVGSVGSSDDMLSTADALVMFKNALKADVEDIVSIGNGEIKKKANGETVLSVYHRISFAKGTLTAINGSTMYTDLDTEKGQAYIDDTAYKCGADYDSYLGSYVEYYYKKEGTSNKEIVYMEELSDKNVVIDIDVFSNYDGGAIRYYKGEKEATASTALGRIVVYNGRPLMSDINNVFNSLNYGTITVKKGENGGNDVILIEDYTDMYVSGVSEKTQTVSDNKLANEVIETEKWEVLTFKDVDGNDIEYKDIPADSILSVKKSKDQTVIFGRVTSSIANGVTNRIYEANGTTRITLDNTEYEMTNVCKDKFKDSLTVGAKYTAYLNIKGKVAYIDTSAGTDMVSGYLLNCIKNDSGFDNNLKIRLVDEKGKIVIFETDDKCIIDGVVYTDAAKAIAAFSSDSGDKTKVEPQLILYKVAKDKIKEIDTYYCNAEKEDAKHTLMRYVPAWNEVAAYSSGRFGWKIPVRTSAIAYNVPETDKISSSSEKKFTCEKATSSTFSSMGGTGITINNVFYKLGTEAVFYDYMATIGEKSVSLNDARLSIVSDIFEKMGDDEEVVTAIALLKETSSGPVKEEYVVDTDLVSLDGLEKGDTIRFAANGNTITTYELLYDESSDALPNWAGITDYWNLYQAYTYYGDVFQLSFGYVNSKKEGILRWGYKSASVADEAWQNNVASRIMIWDTQKEEAFVGGIKDVIDYETYGYGSRIILQTCWSEFRGIVVYI